MLRMFLSYTALVVVVSSGALHAIDPSICSNVMCPKFTCPDGTVNIYSTFKPAVEPIFPEGLSDELIKDSEELQRDSPSTSDSPTATTKSLSRRSVPESDNEDAEGASTQTEYSTAIEQDQNIVEQCCTQSQCICDTGLCPSPKCEAGLVAIVINSDVGRPGNCCPIFDCTHLPNCKAADKQLLLWKENCRSCVCHNGEAQCTPNVCLATKNETLDSDHPEDPVYLETTAKDCFSTNRQQHHLNGTSWAEDECTDCKCQNGEIKCQTSSCKPIACESERFRPEGECCEKCKNFCQGHEYCNKYCFGGYVFDQESGCHRCECIPRQNGTTPKTSSGRGKEGVTEPPTVSGIAPTPSTPSTTTSSTTTNVSQPTPPEHKPSVLVNIYNYNNSTTVSEQHAPCDRKLLMTILASVLSTMVVMGFLCYLFVRRWVHKRGSYSQVSDNDLNANSLTYTKKT